ncbi:hypothetical protein T281_00725 [Rhodomicrobium udaipurense JA643]|nr:hypothetical protein T281_00725 [Rhodomicrobium udaipurense JA643]
MGILAPYVAWLRAVVSQKRPLAEIVVRRNTRRRHSFPCKRSGNHDRPISTGWTRRRGAPRRHPARPSAGHPDRPRPGCYPRRAAGRRLRQARQGRRVARTAAGRPAAPAVRRPGQRHRAGRRPHPRRHREGHALAPRGLVS